MSIALVSPETLARRLQKVMQSSEAMVVLAPGIGAIRLGLTVRFVHTDADSDDELTRLEFHFSPKVASELKARKTRAALSDCARGRLTGVITELATRRFRKGTPFLALVSKPAKEAAVVAETPAMAAAV